MGEIPYFKRPIYCETSHRSQHGPGAWVVDDFNFLGQETWSKKHGKASQLAASGVFSSGSDVGH